MSITNLLLLVPAGSWHRVESVNDFEETSLSMNFSLHPPTYKDLFISRITPLLWSQGGGSWRSPLRLESRAEILMKLQGLLGTMLKELQALKAEEFLPQAFIDRNEEILTQMSQPPMGKRKQKKKSVADSLDIVLELEDELEKKTKNKTKQDQTATSINGLTKEDTALDSSSSSSSSSSSYYYYRNPLSVIVPLGNRTYRICIGIENETKYEQSLLIPAELEPWLHWSVLLVVTFLSLFLCLFEPFPLVFFSPLPL